MGACLYAFAFSVSRWILRKHLLLKFFCITFPTVKRIRGLIMISLNILCIILQTNENIYYPFDSIMKAPSREGVSLLQP